MSTSFINSIIDKIHNAKSASEIKVILIKAANTALQEEGKKIVLKDIYDALYDGGNIVFEDQRANQVFKNIKEALKIIKELLKKPSERK